MKPEELRRNIYLLQNEEIIYLDSASATLVPNFILERLTHHFQTYGGCNSRGVFKQAVETVGIIRSIRKTIADFFHCSDLESIILHSGGTSLGTAICADISSPITDIVIDICAHHSGLLPWMKTRKNFTFINPLTTEEGINQLEKRLKKKERVIVIANHVPMITGDLLNLKTVSQLCKDYNGLLFLDATRSVGHIPINYKEMIDFLVCNSHIGLFGVESTGITVISNVNNDLKAGSFSILGEGTVIDVSQQGYELMGLPHRYEPDLGNIAGYLTAQEGIQLINDIGLDKIRQHELKLVSYLLAELENLPQVKIFGSLSATRKGPIVGFAVKRINSHDVAMWLDGSTNIALRSGLFCSHPFTRYLDPSQEHSGGFLQVSIAYYNTFADIEQFIVSLKEIIQTFS
ncbi:MAG: aminotransferase class V-fold PLP-dependent enzyme [Candidatus Hermodarchaeota archaeon]